MAIDATIIVLNGHRSTVMKLKFALFASLVALAGWSWSSILPSGFAAFAVSLLSCLAQYLSRLPSWDGVLT